MSRICNKCSNPRELLDFYKYKNFKDGYRTICKFCDKDKAKIWNINNSEKHCNHQKSYRENNRQEVNNQRYEYVKENKDKINALSAKRRAAKLNATPKWLTEEHIKEIQKLYIKAKELEKQDGIERHVDHIIPLKGRTVSGLHVPWNLQILTEEENLKKGIKYV